MPFVRVGSVKKLGPGSVMEVSVHGSTIAVCNSEGVIYAVSGICPHAGGPLGQGALHGHMLVCPWHSWEYDCRTGENDFDPEIRISSYPVKIEGDDILVDI
jgi:nitrite reductase/ring-hydroxylating ferredoxin subunit